MERTLKSFRWIKRGNLLKSLWSKNPVVEYKLVSGELYEQMVETIKEQATSFLFKVIIKIMKRKR